MIAKFNGNLYAKIKMYWYIATIIYCEKVWWMIHPVSRYKNKNVLVTWNNDLEDPK